MTDLAPAPVASRTGLPTGFLWGAATAAYQIEGASTEDGRGPSIWDAFSARPGMVRGGGTGAVAVDHYHRYREDVGLMTSLGLAAYRFSVSWPRIQPTGRGPAEQRGLDFYRRLVDELLEHGIEPWLTLYHWDLPQALEEAGGWPVRDTALWFADYAAVVHGALGDRVRTWTTLNEPWCSAFLGYGSGEHAPGRQEPAASVRAAHHLLLGHGLAAEAVRSGGPDSRLAISINLYGVEPVTPADTDAARRIDGLQNRLFLDPVLRGTYPADVVADLAPVTDFDHVLDGDLAAISTPLDVLGINYYSRFLVRDGAGSGGKPGPAGGRRLLASPYPGASDVGFDPGGPDRTVMDWEIHAAGLTSVLTRVATEYDAPPLYVTENGAAFADVLTPDGRVHDRERTAYLAAHLQACVAAVEAGVDLRGYFVWSFLDNFEWAWGYDMRFGVVHVDFPTQRRTLKDSALWYAASARVNTPLPVSVTPDPVALHDDAADPGRPGHIG
ncbi:MAG TPA: beta-glucosidase [Mycobacteriales bacterium]|nr:beta-glucosidase [Mycobacteriales bacterium]